MIVANELIGAMRAEFELMCLAARTYTGPLEHARITTLVQAGVDWPRFLALVERHYVAPLVQRTLQSIGGAGVPAKVLATLRVRCLITQWKSSQLANELARLQEVFDGSGIETINYKGAVAGAQYYGAVTLRNFHDLDFLVRRADLSAVTALLEREGYVNTAPVPADRLDHIVAEFKEFALQRDGMTLEPHWSITGRRYPFEIDYEDFWRRATTLSLDGVPLLVLAPEDALLVLCVVGAKGRWQRLQMVCDVAECVRACDAIIWSAVSRLAAETHTVRILHLGLRLAKELCGAPLPAALDAEMHRTSAVQRLARDVVKSLADDLPPRRFLPDTPAIFSSLLFRQRERWRDRVRYLWRTTTTPSLLHMRRLPLPDWLFPAFWIFVPLHDYALVPGWKFLRSLSRERA